MQQEIEKLDDRMKMYESDFSKNKLDTSLPICVRLDGKGFSKFTKNLTRPFDKRLSQIMIEVSNYLVEKTGACVGYTQSDEITLIFLQNTENADFTFNGKIQKLTSTYAAITSVKFNKLIAKYIPEKENEEPIFDARIWNVPTPQEALNVILWRMRDARKNSISMACHAHIDHKKTLTKNSIERIKMLEEIGVYWSEYPEYFKTGTLSAKVLKQYDTIPAEFKKYHKSTENSFFRTEVENFQMPELLSNYKEYSPKLLEKMNEFKNDSKEIRKNRKIKI